MITQISIFNFKSAKKVSLNLKNLNLLTGVNSVGKSTIVQSLLLMRQSYQKGYWDKKEKFLYLGEDLDKGDLALIGSYEDAIYHFFEKGENYIKFDVKFSENGKLSIKTESYGNFSVTKNSNNRENKVILLESYNLKKTIFQEPLFCEATFQYIQANRVSNENELPKNNLRVKTKDFGIDGRYATHYFLENASKPIPIQGIAIGNESTLEYQVNAWLNYISPNIQVASANKGDREDATSIEQKYSFLYEGVTKTTFKASNIGFGVSYTFSVILALLTAGDNNIIIIENPEAHLHPKGQSKLAELMCLAAQNGVQIFCETHSDHIFNGVRLAVKKFHKGEKGIDKDNAQCFYFRKKGFESEVIPIEMDTNGQINKRPVGLFDEWGNILDQLTD